MLTVQSFVNSPVTSNCYVLFDRDFGNECIIVDPGSRSEKELIDYLVGESLIPKYIILTHEHFDHCWGVNELVERYHIPIICSELCAEAIKHEKKNCSVFYDNKDPFVINNETIKVEEIDYELLFEGMMIKFFLTPGHTEASICFSIAEFFFTGDTLIKDMRTITKLPTGSLNRLQYSIELIKSMAHRGYTVCPGHGNCFMLDDYDFGSVF
jgi:glyoxylase-like metal-dependent hydrolase (beta-lactamase superfamily II)